MKTSLSLFLLVMIASDAFAQDAKVRTSLATKGDLWVGQRVTLVVELLAPGFFSGTPSFDMPDPQGLVLIPPRGSPTIGTETIDGISYTVQRHELFVFPRRAGEQIIPSLTVRFGFKRQPLDKDVVAATVKTEAVKFTAKPPPGAEKLGSIISARNLTAVESWKPEPGKAKAGDAFTRTITFAAPDVPAMAFPPFPTGKIDGLGIYPQPPQVLDQSDRGQMSGQRLDTVTYVCQRAGQFIIPPVRLSWFDLDAQKLQVIEFPSHTIDVAPNPAMAAAERESQVTNHFEMPSLRNIGIMLAIIVAASYAIMVSRRNWSSWIAPLRPLHLQPLNPVKGDES